MKHTQRWTYSARDFEIPLCHTPPLRSFLESISNILNQRKGFDPSFSIFDTLENFNPKSEKAYTS